MVTNSLKKGDHMAIFDSKFKRLCKMFPRGQEMLFPNILLLPARRWRYNCFWWKLMIFLLQIGTVRQISTVVACSLKQNSWLNLSELTRHSIQHLIIIYTFLHLVWILMSFASKSALWSNLLRHSSFHDWLPYCACQLVATFLTLWHWIPLEFFHKTDESNSVFKLFFQSKFHS